MGKINGCFCYFYANTCVEIICTVHCALFVFNGMSV